MKDRLFEKPGVPVDVREIGGTDHGFESCEIDLEQNGQFEVASRIPWRGIAKGAAVVGLNALWKGAQIASVATSNVIDELEHLETGPTRSVHQDGYIYQIDAEGKVVSKEPAKGLDIHW